MRISTLLIFISSLLLCGTVASSQTTEDDYWRSNLGMFDGLVLMCTFDGAPALDEVCQSVSTDFGFLTATANVKSLDCSGCSWVDFYQRTSEAGIYIPLRVDVLVASTKDGTFLGGFAQVSAKGDFTQVVCIVANNCEEVPINPDVHYWMRYLTFSGSADQITPATLSTFIEDHLKGLITIYVKANRNSN